MFALLTITLLVGRPFRVSIAGLVFYLVLFAGVSEVLQLFMVGRSAQLGDIAIDCGGILSGLVLAGLWKVCFGRA
jgi:VanZ family protein